MAAVADIIDLGTGGVVLPFTTGQYKQPVTGPGGYTGIATEWFLVLIGIVLVALAYDRSPKFGALFLFIIVLSMLYAGKQRRAF